jgi:hypothetical protein
MTRLNLPPTQPIWQWWGNMLCDRAVTHAFDAVPDSSTHKGAERQGALCINDIPASH